MTLFKLFLFQIYKLVIMQAPLAHQNTPFTLLMKCIVLYLQTKKLENVDLLSIYHDKNQDSKLCFN